MKRFVIAMLLVAACGGAGPEQPNQKAGQIERTVVVLQPNGSPKVRTETISAEEHQRELSRRQQRPMATAQPGGGNDLSVDPGCGDSSLWIFDSPNNMPGASPNNHELCLYRNGVAGCADLSNYTRYCDYAGPGGGFSCTPWTGSAIGSYYSGTDAGSFSGYMPPAGWGSQPFGTLERVDSVSSLYWVRNARWVCFN